MKHKQKYKDSPKTKVTCPHCSKTYTSWRETDIMPVCPHCNESMATKNDIVITI